MDAEKLNNVMTEAMVKAGMDSLIHLRFPLTLYGQHSRPMVQLGPAAYMLVIVIALEILAAVISRIKEQERS